MANETYAECTLSLSFPPSISLILPGCHSYLKLLSYSLPSFGKGKGGEKMGSAVCMAMALFVAFHSRLPDGKI